MTDVLFRKADELSGAAREFYQFVSDKSRKFTDPKRNGGKGFYARNVREENRIHPRTLNRYLNELAEYGLLQITGGNKNTTGYSYKLVKNRSYEALQKSIDGQIEKVVQAVWKAYEERKPKHTLTKIEGKKQKELARQ